MIEASVEERALRLIDDFKRQGVGPREAFAVLVMALGFMHAEVGATCPDGSPMTLAELIRKLSDSLEAGQTAAELTRKESTS